MAWQIAIDGPAGAGKSTVAKKVAEQLGFVYLDTGAMYRAVAFEAMQAGVDVQDEAQMKALLQKIELSFSKDGKQIFCNGDNISEQIRLPEVSSRVSTVAAIPQVREAMAEQQRQIAQSCNVVMDGRDIGTVILPNAQVKIFMTASLEMRTKRRLEELRQKGIDADYESLYQEIAERDEKDRNREVAPLKMADDAILLDTTDYNIDSVVKNVLLIIENKGVQLT